MTNIFFIDTPQKLEAVYGSGIESLGLDTKKYYTKADLTEKKDELRSVKNIFSTWYMPILTKEEIKEFFPSLEAVYYAAKNNFTTGDKLVLTATGYLGSIVTGEASITMASVDSVMYNWTKFDLEKLGSVDKIDFKLSSSNGSFGVPMTFCLDNFQADVETK